MPTSKFKSRLKVTLVSLILISSVSFAQDHTEWSYNLGMYEVNVRQYTQEGTFNAFKTHLGRLKEMGVGILWFMPIHPIGEKNRLGTLGSYYSVKDYYGINPEFGTLEDFKSLVDTAHEMGFYVLIDWVANHTSWDNPLTESHPEYYTKDEDGNFMPPAGTDWSDVIDLDYSQPGLHTYMINAMKYWITETNIDGFRCDAASMVPLDFWQSAISELKSTKSEILMLAEADGEDYYDAGFDMTFAWELYGFGGGLFTQIVDGLIYPANFLSSFLKRELSDFQDNQYRLYFTSNHDENSWYGTVFERFGNAAETFAAITLTMNGMPLIYSGQEAGLNHRLQFFEKDQINWNTLQYEKFYSTLLDLKRNNIALWNGSMGGKAERVLTNNNPAIFAFVREKEKNKIFAIFNLTDSTNTVIPNGDLFKGEYVDVFSSDTVIFDEGSEVNLLAWGYKIYNSVSGITSVNERDEIPNDLLLLQNYPNPFNPTTKIRFSIPTSAIHSSVLYSKEQKELFANLVVYDMLGREVKTLVKKNLIPGDYEIEFNAEGLPSGIYFYKLSIDNFSQSKKMMYIK